MSYGAYKDRWRAWLSTKRFDKEDQEGMFSTKNAKEQECRSSIDADIGRIVFSQPFRRLAGKTQVHPFSSVDYVHNRLTHSIEVGYVSYELGKRVASFILNEKGDLQTKDQINEIGLICQAAGLMHDIGNPPYGHAGEDAIRAWASQLEIQKNIKNLCGEKILNDFLYFDGNAQAFRMAINLMPRETCYFKLTLPVLGAMIKYPWTTNSKKGKESKKSTAFSSEEQIFGCLMKEFGLKEGQRHPLSFITEAADDICYRISDFEDAVLMGIIDDGAVKKLLLDGMTFDCQQRLKTASLQRIKAKAIGDLIDAFVSAFKDKYEDIVRGTMIGDLKSTVSDRWGGVLARIKQKYESIFSERKKVITEIGSYGQIERILERYLKFLSAIKTPKGNPVQYSELPFACQRLVTLAWGGSEYYKQNASQNVGWWAHAVLDCVVGMTDDYLQKIAVEIL